MTADFAIVNVSRVQYRQYGQIGRNELVAIVLLRVTVYQRFVVCLPCDVARLERVGVDDAINLNFSAFACCMSGAVYFSRRSVC